MTYEQQDRTLKVDRKLLNEINHYLAHEPKDASECLSEDETISKTVQFDDGYSVEVKCCGVKFEPYTEEQMECGSSNKAWTEAVLLHDGNQVACTDPSDTFEDEWILYDDDDNEFRVNVVAA